MVEKKRKRESAIGSSPQCKKHSRTDAHKVTNQHQSEGAVDLTGDDDDLQAILLQIKQQEESEALARKLQAEWDSDAIDIGEVSLSEASNEPGSSESASYNLSSTHIQVNTSTKVSRAYPAEGESETPDSKLREFCNIFTYARPCSKCKTSIDAPRGHVVFAGSALPPSLLFLLHVPCQHCRTNHCRGCMKPVDCPLDCKGRTKNAACQVDKCCAEVRAIALFEALGGFDKLIIGERETSNSRAIIAAGKQKQATATSGRGGTGYGAGGSVLPYGAGSSYVHHGARGRGKRGSGFIPHTQHRTEELANHWEHIVVRAFTTLTDLLPSPYTEDPQVYDMLPHPSTGFLLATSLLPDLLSSLLRNDSVTDWIARSETYYAMIALLRRMADCELTVQVLIGPRWQVKQSCGLEEWMWGDGELTWEAVDDENGIKAPDRAAPLYEYFRKLAKQCEIFLAGATQLMGDEDDGDTEELALKATSLCGDLIAARDDIDRAMTVLGRVSSDHSSTLNSLPCGKGKGRDPTVDMETLYSRNCERLGFKYVSLAETSKTDGSQVYACYNYTRELQSSASSTRLPKDRLHLIKELAVMSTSLPPGVWVRVDEVRNDAIKIMIAGPDGTPYEGGLFEFDCFMPLEYPNKPPLVHLRTTGGGRVRFNPNLYNNGKVCLSLLGTWPGRPEEQWNPQKSTLLHVLVSIQSMILIDFPYFNEPGFGQANPESPASIAYNENIEQQTCRWAIVEWLKDEHFDGIWGEVIASHFTIRKTKISECLHKWAARNPSIRKYCATGATIQRAMMSAVPGGGGMYVASASDSYWGPGRPSASSTSKTMDLLNEFDCGMERLQNWRQKTLEVKCTT